MIYERLRVFVSSRMQELAPERAAIRAVGIAWAGGFEFHSNLRAVPGLGYFAACALSLFIRAGRFE